MGKKMLRGIFKPKRKKTAGELFKVWKSSLYF
jgi:hypothetical protein